MNHNIYITNSRISLLPVNFRFGNRENMSELGVGKSRKKIAHRFPIILRNQSFQHYQSGLEVTGLMNLAG